MATSPRQLWLAALKGALEGIDGAGTYKSTVVKVERVLRDPGEVPLEARPWIGVLPISGRADYQPGYQVRAVERVHLYCYVPGGSELEVANALDDLLDDVFAALGNNQTLNETCCDVKVLEYATDEGDGDGDTSKGAMELKLDVTYYREARSS